MGYEILYKYHERQEDGKYNTEELKEMKKKVGNPTDDIPLEQIAATIRAQLARRKIWIVDVEIYEFTKKKLSFKEADDGSIIIKNKKFSPNNTATDLIVYETDDEESSGSVDTQELIAQAQMQGLQPHEVMARMNAQTPQRQQQPANVNLAPQRSVQQWVFDPEPHLLAQSKQAGLKMTPGKKYPVYQIDSPSPAQALMGASQVFHVDDDYGRKKKVGAEYFVTATQGRLVGDNEVDGGFSQPVARLKEPRLSFENNFIENQKTAEMPDLRSRGRQIPSMPQVDPRLAGIDPREMAYGESFDQEYVDDMPDIRAGK